MNWLALIPLAVLLFFSHRTMYRMGRTDARIDQQLADFERDGRVCDEAEVQPWELLAVIWNDEMAQRFPNAEHALCRQTFEKREDGMHPYDPPRCIGWHCNRCGKPTSCQGHHDCPDRPAAVDS